MKKEISETELRELITARADKTSRAGLAAQLGISRSYMSQIILGQCPISDEIAEKFGFKRKPKPKIEYLYEELPAIT